MKKIILLINLIFLLGFTSYSQLINNDATVISIDLSTTLCAGMEDVYATIGNDGENQIDSVEIHWEVNGISMSMLKYKQLLDTANGSSSDTAQVFLGSGNFNSGTNTIKIWVSSPNGVQDPISSNDTMEVSKDFAMNGNYTINSSLATGGVNFNSFSDAVNSLDTYGICGPVNFEVSSGTYNEKVIIPEIQGANNFNTITFDGLDSSLTILKATSNATGTFILDSADHIILKNMSIVNTGTANAAVLFGHGSHHNTITNCVLKVASSTSSTSITVAYSGDITSTNGFNSYSSYNSIQYNHIINGHTSIRMPNYGVYNRVLFNDIDSSYNYGLYLFNQDSLEVVGNLIDAVSAGNSGSFGTYFSSNVNSIFNRNYVHANSYGVVFMVYNIPTGTKKVKKYEVINNMIVSESGVGLYIISVDSLDLLHNSVYVHGPSPAVQLTSKYADIRNNIFHGGSAIALDASQTMATLDTMDNNIYFTNGSILLSIEGNSYSDIATFQTAYSNYNSSSLEGDPKFESSTDLHVAYGAYLANGTGDNSVGVSLDFDGDNRPLSASSSVDIGADEFNPPTLNASVAELIAPTGLLCAGSYTPIVSVGNFGADTIVSFDLIYSVNANYDTIHFSGSILPSQRQNISLNSMMFNTGIDYEFIVYTDKPNAGIDVFPQDDTLSFEIKTGLSGIYTIDASSAASSSNYLSFTDAVNDLNKYGLCGAVTFDVASGTYTESVILNEVSGASATNTITFNGASNSTTKLTSNSTNAATFVLNASDYITISNMEIESTSKSNAAIKLERGSEYNAISNNIIKVPVANISSSTSSTALLFDAAVSYNTVESNTVLYGNYGIRLIGTTAEPGVYNSFLNNYIDSVYAYSFHADFQDSLIMIGNKILSVGSAASNFVFAAYLSNTVNATFEKNNIHSKTYGVLFQNFSIPTASVREKKYEIINNMIISDGYYGVWMQGIDSVDFYHNSVLGGASTPALRIQNSSTGIADYDVRNNILHGSQGPAIETDVLDSIFSELDYNIYYTTGTNLFKINSVNHVNLAAYQTASPSLNVSSIEGNPQFASSSDLHMHQPIANNVGDNSVGIKDDIDGDDRPIATDTVVDIGADEYRISTIDVKVVGLLAPIEVVNKCYSTNEDVIVGLSNLGMDSLNFTVDTAEITVEVSGKISQNFTYVLDNNTLNNGNSLSPLAADSIQVLMGTIDMSLPGKYYFKVSIDLKSDIDSLNNIYEDSVIVSSPVGGKVSGTDTICFGDSTILSVEAFIGGKVQWQYLDGRAWNDIAGATDETIKVSPGNSTSYRVVTCGLYFLPSDSFTLDVVSPSLPTAIHDTVKVNCGDVANVTLQAVSNDPNAKLEWYDRPVGGSKLISSSNIYINTKGDSLTYSVTPFSPSLPSLDTFYVEEVIGTAGKLDTLTAVNFTGGSSCNGGNMFDVIGKNDFSIDGFLINSYTTGWQTVEVYVKNGTYATSVSSSNDWTHLESVDVFGNGTGVPSHLKLTDSIVVNPGDTIGIYIDYDANYTNVTMGTSYSNDDMEVVLGYGFCTPFQFGNAGRGFNGRILYSSGCTSGRVAVVGRAECKVTDLKISTLTSPVSQIDSCYSSSESIELKLLNLGSEELDFSVDTAWINVDVSGAATQAYSMVLNDNLLNAGLPLSAGDSIIINMGNQDMSSHGSYDFTAYSSLVLDENFANDTFSISIINSPSAGSLNIVKNVCDSGMVDLETTGAAGSLQWQRLLGSSFADEINADSSSYTVYVDSTVSFRVIACGTEISDTLVVNPNPTPLAPTTYNDTAVVLCGDSGTAVLTASSINSSDGFAWYDSINAGTHLSSADTFYFGHTTVAGIPSVYIDTFFVSAVDSLTGCESERSMVTGIVWCTIGEEERPSALSGISIQPNPSKGVFNLIGNNVEEVLDVSIYNSNGKAVYQAENKVSNNFNEQIDLSGLAKGMYFIKFQGEKSMEMRKVVIH